MRARQRALAAFVGSLVLGSAACGASGPAPVGPEPVVSTKEPESAGPEILKAHNRLRAQHCADPLVWSEEVATAAQAWANTLRAQGCALSHSSSRYGENLFFSAPAGNRSQTDVVESWYSERQHYNFRSQGFSMRTGHFTQVIWRASRELGCGSVQCNGGELWVCNYSPAGNVRGQYGENVRPESCR